MKFYTPSKFTVKDRRKEIEFLNKYPFSTLISNVSGELELSKIPLLLKEEGEDLYLEGHFSKANPHWKTIQEDPQLTILFDGAHGYVSPSWYMDPVNNVPTWNYSTILVSAQCEIIEDKKWIVSSLRELADKFEENQDWINNVNKEYFNNLTSGVVGIRAKVQSMRAKFKLSLNKSKEDQERVAAKLSEKNKELAQDMRRWIDE